VGRGRPVRASSSSPAMVDGGGSSPIYRLEGLEAKQTGPGGGRTGPEAPGGEVAAGGAALHMAGRRVALPGGLGRVASGGTAS
jgi:hypothetical protein